MLHSHHRNEENDNCTDAERDNPERCGTTQEVNVGVTPQQYNTIPDWCDGHQDEEHGPHNSEKVSRQEMVMLRMNLFLNLRYQYSLRIFGPLILSKI